MQGFAEGLQWVERAAYTAIAVVSLRLALRHRTPATMWAALAFASLEAIVIVGAFAGPGGAALPDHVVKVLLAVVLVFPYCLFRFAAAFTPPKRWVARAGVGLTGLLIVWAFFLPEIPARGTPHPGAIRVFALAVVAQWTLMSGWATARLWLSSRGQPTLPRRRLRLLGAAALGLNLAVVISGVVGGRRTPAILLAQQAIGLAGAILFYIGLNPPSLLRRSWRRGEEQSLRQAAVAVTAATTAAEVADALLPHISPIFGGGGALLAGSDGELHGVHRMAPAEAAGIVARLADDGQESLEPTLVPIRMRSGWLVVRASPYSPLFGLEESEMLGGIGLFVDLALERAARFEMDRRLVNQLQNTLDLRNRLVSSVSHELRTPLTSIIGFSETLTDRWTALEEADRRTFVGKISEHARELTDLVESLLDYATVESGRVSVNLEPVDIAAEIEATLSALAPVLEGRHVEVEAGSRPGRVLANPVLLRRTLNNLLTNAAKYSPPTRPIRVRALRAGSACRVEVIDEGPGLSREEAERAFEPFWRGERDSSRVRGAGIGLSLVREYTRLMGGDVDVESTPGHGSTFYFTLPIDVTSSVEASLAV